MEKTAPVRVALDAGHGARPGRPYTGAAANGLVEDDLTLDLIKRIGHLLRAAGHETVYTRPDNKLVALNKRGKIARDTHCGLFLSIHCNAGPKAACGVEAFVVKGDAASRSIAQRLVDGVSAQGLSNRGVKWDSQSQYSRLAVLRGTYRHMPAILLEVGFLTNRHDSRLLSNKYFREYTAIEIAGVVVEMNSK